MINETHRILQENEIITSDRDKICYNYGEDIRTIFMRSIKQQTENREEIINQLNRLIKHEIYHDIALYDIN